MADRYASGASYGSAWFIGLVGAMSFQQWVTLIGLLLGVATYLTNLWFKYRQDKRESVLAQARLAAQLAQVDERRVT